jgi:hypothetical protein
VLEIRRVLSGGNLSILSAQTIMRSRQLEVLEFRRFLSGNSLSIVSTQMLSTGGELRLSFHKT